MDVVGMPCHSLDFLGSQFPAEPLCLLRKVPGGLPHFLNEFLARQCSQGGNLPGPDLACGVQLTFLTRDCASR